MFNKYGLIFVVVTVCVVAVSIVTLIFALKTSQEETTENNSTRVTTSTEEVVTKETTENNPNRVTTSTEDVKTVKPCPEYYFDTPRDQLHLNSMKTSERARSFCHDRGDTLPTPRSAKEFKCFSSFASGYSTWLGFKRNVGENNFRDMEGRAMDYSNFTSTELGPPPKEPECVITINYIMYRVPCKTRKFVACQRN